MKVGNIDENRNEEEAKAKWILTMWDSKQALADEAEVFGLEGVSITTRDHDVLDDWCGGDVLEHVLPALAFGFQGGFGYGGGVGSDGVRAGAVAAVEGAVRNSFRVQVSQCDSKTSKIGALLRSD
jgi:hypothetical protein